MKKFYFFLFAILFTVVSNAQITGTKTIGADYPTLAAAITDLNTVGVGTGGAIINLPGGYTETAPAGGYLLGSATLNASLSATKTLTIQKSGTGASPLLTAPVGTSTTADAIFILAGADFTTINGISLVESAGNTTATTAMERGFFVVNLNAAAPFDGCKNNIIQNCTVTLNRTIATPSIGIYFAHATSDGTAVTIAAADDAHSNNKVYGNKITNCIRGIYVIGFNAASPFTLYDQGNDIGGTSAATGNTITNFGTQYASVFGIIAQYQNGLNVSNNTINNMADGGVTTNGTLYGINVYGLGSTITVNNNTVAVTQTPVNTSYYVYAIACDGAASFTANKNNITSTLVSGSVNTSIQNGGLVSSATVLNATNNTIALNHGNNSVSAGMFITGAGTSVNYSNNSYTFKNTAASSGAQYGLYSGGALTGNLTIQDNTISASSAVNASGAFYGIFSGGTVAGQETIANNKFDNIAYATSGSVYLINANNASNNKTITTNAIAGALTKSVAGGSVYGYYNFGTPTGGASVITGNNFSNATVTGATTFYGIYNYTATAQRTAIEQNIVNNITGGTNATYGFYLGDGNATSTLSNNTVTNITGGGTTYGLYLTGSGNAATAGSNTINGLATNGASSPVFGAYVAGGTDLKITRNKISNITANGATGIANGITVAAGTQSNIYNNFISDLKAPSANAATSSVNGINVSSTSSLSNINVYYNTINISAASSGAVFSTAGVQHTANATATTAKLTLINNIIRNTSVANGATGFTAAFRRNNTNLGNYSTASNNNLFYAGVPSVSNLIFYDGTNADQTLSDYQTRVATRDAASISVIPDFVSSTDFHLNTASNCNINGKGAVITGYTTDIDGDTRNTSAPTIGADEFVSTYTLKITNPARVCSPGTVNLTAPSVTAGSTPGSTFTYWPDATTTTPIPAASGTPAAISVSGTYIIKSSGAGGCTALQAVVVAVNALPTISLSTNNPPVLLPTENTSIIANVNPAGGTFAWFKNASPLLPAVTTGVLSSLGVDNAGTYKAIYTDPNGCISTSADLVISAEASSKMFLGPNPNFGQFSVRYYQVAGEQLTLSVYSANGNKVYQKATTTSLAYTQIAVDLDSAAPGVYMVELRNSTGKLLGSKKIIVGRR